MPALQTVTYLADGTPIYSPQPVDAALLPYQQHALAAPIAPAPQLLVAQPLAAPVVPAPGRDPWPARLLCGGIGVGAAGLGLGFALQAVAAATTGLALLLGVLVVAGFLLRSGGRSGVNVRVNVRNG
ncbi:hypothetical protein ABZ773_33545 [Streptomyces sp. NPDC047804]|uniref:hypothetical protein n=1 Tax=Streptomyces sp. NPDC047804 TaxID=3156663 RepID=UPI0033F8E9B4